MLARTNHVTDVDDEGEAPPLIDFLVPMLVGAVAGFGIGALVLVTALVRLGIL